MNGDDTGDSPSQRYQRQRLKRAQAALSEWPDASGAIATLRDWVAIRGVALEGKLRWSELRRLPHAAQPSAALAVAGHGDAADAVDIAVEDHLQESPAGRLLFGLAAAEAAHSVTNPSVLENLVVFAAQDPVTAFAFGKRFCDEAAAHPDSVAALAAAAQSVVERFHTDPGSFVMGRHGESFSERVRMEGGGTRVEELWSDRLGDEILLFGRGYLLDLLRSLDTQAYLSLLQRFGHPAPVRACLALIRDPDTLLHLLPQAPAAFVGADWTGAMVRPLLVLAYFGLVAVPRSNSNADGSGREFEPSAAPARLADTLLRLDVGEAMLAQHFQAYLVKQFGLRFRENSGREPEPRDGPRFIEWSFITTMAGALPASENVSELLSNVPERDRLYALVAAALSRDAQVGSTDDLADALERIACSLEAVATFASGDLLPEHWHMTQLAGVLAHASDPIERWSQLWRRTSPLRDQASHRRAHAAHELLYIAPFLLCLGLRAYDYLYKSTSVALRLWSEVHKATLETYLVEQLLRERLNDIVVRVVVRALHLSKGPEPHSGAATTTSHLSKAVAAYLIPDALAAKILLSLELNGVSPLILARITNEEGRNLVALCTEIETLAELGAIRTLSTNNRVALRQLSTNSE